MAPSHSSEDSSSQTVMWLMGQIEGALRHFFNLLVKFLRSGKGLDHLKTVQAAEDYDEYTNALVRETDGPDDTCPPTLLTPSVKRSLWKMAEGDQLAWIDILGVLVLIVNEVSNVNPDSNSELTQRLDQTRQEYSMIDPLIISAAYPPDSSGMRHLVMMESDYRTLMRFLPSLPACPGQSGDWFHRNSTA